MHEQEPLYFKEFRKHFDKKIDDSVAELAGMTKRQFDFMEEKMATKSDLNLIYEVMATKEDIKNMATKDDIKNMATKNDIALIHQTMATKDDIALIHKTMATKDDIKELDAHIGKYERRLQSLEGVWA